jgi:hypothetical protein
MDMVVSLLIQTAQGIRLIALHEQENRARKIRSFILGKSRLISYRYQHLVYSILTSFLGSNSATKILEYHYQIGGQ